MLFINMYSEIKPSTPIKPQNKVYSIFSNSVYSFAAKWAQHIGILPLIFISILNPTWKIS